MPTLGVCVVTTPGSDESDEGADGARPRAADRPVLHRAGRRQIRGHRNYRPVIFNSMLELRPRELSDKKEVERRDASTEEREHVEVGRNVGVAAGSSSLLARKVLKVLKVRSLGTLRMESTGHGQYQCHEVSTRS